MNRPKALDRRLSGRLQRKANADPYSKPAEGSTGLTAALGNTALDWGEKAPARIEKASHGGIMSRLGLNRLSGSKKEAPAAVDPAASSAPATSGAAQGSNVLFVSCSSLIREVVLPPRSMLPSQPSKTNCPLPSLSRMHPENSRRCLAGQALCRLGSSSSTRRSPQAASTPHIASNAGENGQWPPRAITEGGIDCVCASEAGLVPVKTPKTGLTASKKNAAFNLARFDCSCTCVPWYTYSDEFAHRHSADCVFATATGCAESDRARGDHDRAAGEHPARATWRLLGFD